MATLKPVETKETFQSVKNINNTLKVKEPMIITKEDKQIIEQIIPKPELILNNNVHEKQNPRLSDEKSKILTPKNIKQIDNINNTSVFPVK